MLVSVLVLGFLLVFCLFVSIIVLFFDDVMFGFDFVFGRLVVLVLDYVLFLAYVKV